MTACIGIGVCKYAVPESAAAGRVAKEIAYTKSRLVKTYSEIKREAGENARIYVHGYPKFVSSDMTSCGLNVLLTQEERLFIDQGVHYFNQIVQSAALEAGVFYVDVENVLQGVNLCSDVSDQEMAVNGATIGDDASNWLLDIGTNGICLVRNGCIGNESYHPNQNAHRRYAQAISFQTNNFRAAMPQPTPNDIPMPNHLFFGSEARDLVNQLNSKEKLPVISSDYLRVSTANQGDQSALINITAHNLAPRSDIRLEVHSDPQPLGNGDYIADDQGNFETTVSLPDNLPGGVHEIVVKGVNRFGEPVAIYEPIMIAYSKDDFDGDGVKDDIDSCPTITNSGTDQDQDGIDDACDGQIKAENNNEDTNQTNLEKGQPNPETVAGTGAEYADFNSEVLGDSSTKTNQTALVSTGINVVSTFIFTSLISLIVIVAAMITSEPNKLKRKMEK